MVAWGGDRFAWPASLRLAVAVCLAFAHPGAALGQGAREASAIANGGDFPASGAPAKGLSPLPRGRLDRTGEPVVLLGKQLPAFRAAGAGNIVAFRFDGKWLQIPVQVDERAVVDYHDVYARRFFPGPCFKNLVYTDPGTFTGADPKQGLDDDDEVVFMADDAGAKPIAWSWPQGVVVGKGVEVAITDPLDEREAFVYLFLAKDKLDPSADRRYVRYDFKLGAGAYRERYGIGRGPNPEDSRAATPVYARHFSDRWVADGLAIRRPGGTGADILDMHKSMFAPGDGRRSVRTFCLGEGAFVANRSGPVRAIRSYVGCNSGPLTQRRHVFYAGREEVVTFLRVHPIGGIVDFFDYSLAAKGMIYRNNLNVEGVTIDGSPDRVAAGVLTWEAVQGPQGTLVIVHRLHGSMKRPDQTSYYLDSAAPSTAQVTGDRHAFGSSGPWFPAMIPNTDPRLGAGRAQVFTAVRWLFYEPADAPADRPIRRLRELANPLRARVASVPE